MKKIFTILCCIILAALAATTLFACTAKPDQNEQNTFTGITFEDKTITYDGTEHSLEISGTLPEGADVKYENNKGVNAGTYSAKAVISKENYQTLTLNAVLTIEKASFTGITLDSETVFYNGKPHSLAIKGTLPEGSSVTYTNNDQTEGGEYEVTATLTNPNYETLILKANLNIRTLADAVSILNKVLTRPDAWSFLPQAFLPENFAYSSMPAADFSDFVSVGEIGTRSIGKQMKVVYDTLNTAQSALEKADVIYTAGETIAAVYQTFINDNPDSYQEFTASVTIGGIDFSLKISVQDDISVLLIGNSTISIELKADSKNNLNSGRIQITDGVVLKYEAAESSLKLAINAEISAVKIAQSLEFVRSDNTVTGYLYEYYGAGSAAIKTTALITSNENYTIVTADKRETDDLKIEAYEEVYDSKTGKLLGCEVAETVSSINFDTLWFHLSDVKGFSSVRAENTQNNLNADTIYVNNSDTAFETKNVGGLGTDMFSRRYDIEMKEVWYIVSTIQNDKIVYETEKVLVPMLFVQKDNLDTFSSDVESKNDSLENVSLPATVSITSPFETMKTTYLNLKQLVSYEEIQSFIGEKDSFFSKE